MNIKPCTSCFHCWVKTPGICVIPDQSRDVAREQMASDLVVLISPVTFGGYSYTLKLALDRLIPNVLSYFRRFKREIHYRLRYRRYPRPLVLGWQQRADEAEAAVFCRLVSRNALNFFCQSWQAAVFYPGRLQPEQCLDTLLLEVTP